MEKSWAGEADPPETREERRARAVPVPMAPLRLHEDPNPPAKRIAVVRELTGTIVPLGKKTEQARLDFFAGE